MRSSLFWNISLAITCAEYGPKVLRGFKKHFLSLFPNSNPVIHQELINTAKDWAARYPAPEGCKVEVRELDTPPTELRLSAGNEPGVLFTLEASGAVHTMQMWLPLGGGKGVIAVTSGGGPVAGPELTEWETVMVGTSPLDPNAEPVTVTGLKALEIALSSAAGDFCRDYIFGPAIVVWFASKGVDCGKGSFDFPDMELLEHDVQHSWCVLQFDPDSTNYPECDMVTVSGRGEAAFLVGHHDEKLGGSVFSFLDPPVSVRSVAELEKWLAEQTGL